MELVERERAAHATSRLAERVGRRYLLCLLLVLLLGYLFPFAAERIAVLKPFSVSHWGRILDYGYGLDGQDADVLIFGDSTAIYGADTPRLSRELGLKVINLPGTLGSLPVTGDAVLRRYLAHNRPPHLIVFYFAPWNLDFDGSENKYSYEGDEQVLRHESGGGVDAIRRKPLDFLAFPFRFYAQHVSERYETRKVIVVQGHTAYPPSSSLLDGCALPLKLLGQTGTASVERLVREYSSTRTRTLVYLAPLPDCLNAAQEQAVVHPGVEAAPPAILPHRDFSPDNFYVHVLAPYEAESSDLLAQAIRKAIER